MVIISLLVCLIICVIACSFAIWCKLDYIGKVLEFKNEPIQMWPFVKGEVEETP